MATRLDARPHRPRLQLLRRPMAGDPFWLPDSLPRRIA